jgi:multimeric flavodoxin WrbA
MPQEELAKIMDHLATKSRVLFLTTSNRWAGEKGGEQPKSTQLAYKMQERLGVNKVELIDVTKLIIYPCEGNVSTERGNTCGLKEALLADPEKNPSGLHRCWASVNNPDDELWKISKKLFNSDCVMFFASVRWGQTNSFYQRLIERLTWIENRHSTLQEENVVRAIDAGLILLGQNWRGAEVLATQERVLSYFGFKTVPELFWHWQFTTPDDESPDSYKHAAEEFQRLLANF